MMYERTKGKRKPVFADANLWHLQALLSTSMAASILSELSFTNWVRAKLGENPKMWETKIAVRRWHHHGVNVIVVRGKSEQHVYPVRNWEMGNRSGRICVVCAKTELHVSMMLVSFKSGEFRCLGHQIRNDAVSS